MHIAGVVTSDDNISVIGRRAQMPLEKCKIGSHIIMIAWASLVYTGESSVGKPYLITLLVLTMLQIHCFPSPNER